MAKKRGRPKKRGPKKKQPPKVYKERPTWDYKIVSCRNGKQNGYIGKYVTAREAYSVIEKLMIASANVVMPKKVVNSKNETESYDEYIILKRNKGNESTPLLRNDYGKLVEHKTNTDKWVILDKFRYNVEETYWVYGYDPRSQRKTFMWVYEHLLVERIENRYDFKRVMIYNNKLIIKDDAGKIDIVFCKNKSEAIRCYNLLQEKAIADKHPEIVFQGAYGGKGARTSNLIKEICDYAGWTRKKVVRTTTF